MKRNHVWVIEKFEDGKWIVWEAFGYMATKAEAVEDLRKNRSSDPGGKFRLRKYEAAKEG